MIPNTRSFRPDVTVGTRIQQIEDVMNQTLLHRTPSVYSGSRFGIVICGLALGCLMASVLSQEGLRHERNREQPRLNSERIEATFGSYGIDVLEETPVRVSMLHSVHDGDRICRTFAIVCFAESFPKAFRVPMNKVRKGASLGATLKDAGFLVEKRPLQIGEIPSGPRFLELAKLESSQDLAFFSYELSAQKDGEAAVIATIIEVYHPDYLTLEQLRTLTPLAPNRHDDETTTRLKQLAVSKMRKQSPL
ncbi:MAG: hypothetical protein AAF491_09815 [Verrucomicrobiota bacterium]